SRGIVTAPSILTWRASNNGVYEASANAATRSTGSATIAIVFARRVDRSGRIEAPHEPDLGLEPHAGRGGDPVLDHSDQRGYVGRGRTRTGDYEVRVLARDGRATDPRSLEPCSFDQGRRVLSRRVREDAAAVRLGERLRAPPPLARPAHPGADLLRVACPQDERGAEHDRVGRKGRSAVREPGIVVADGDALRLGHAEQLDGVDHVGD